MHPAWWFDLTTEPLEFASLKHSEGTVAELVVRLFDPAATIADLAWLRSIWDRPLLVKGILNASDARAVVDAERMPSSCRTTGDDSSTGPPPRWRRCLPLSTRRATRAEVYVDGGVMSGSDIVAAVALGARPPWWDAPISTG